MGNGKWDGVVKGIKGRGGKVREEQERDGEVEGGKGTERREVRGQDHTGSISKPL